MGVLYSTTVPPRMARPALPIEAMVLKTPGGEQMWEPVEGCSM